MGWNCLGVCGWTSFITKNWSLKSYIQDLLFCRGFPWDPETREMDRELRQLVVEVENQTSILDPTFPIFAEAARRWEEKLDKHQGDTTVISGDMMVTIMATKKTISVLGKRDGWREPRWWVSWSEAARGSLWLLSPSRSCHLPELKGLPRLNND